MLQIPTNAPRRYEEPPTVENAVPERLHSRTRRELDLLLDQVFEEQLVSHNCWCSLSPIQKRYFARSNRFQQHPPTRESVLKDARVQALLNRPRRLLA